MFWQLVTENWNIVEGFHPGTGDEKYGERNRELDNKSLLAGPQQVMRYDVGLRIWFSHRCYLAKKISLPYKAMVEISIALLRAEWTKFYLKQREIMGELLLNCGAVQNDIFEDKDRSQCKRLVQV